MHAICVPLPSSQAIERFKTHFLACGFEAAEAARGPCNKCSLSRRRTRLANGLVIDNATEVEVVRDELWLVIGARASLYPWTSRLALHLVRLRKG